MPCLIESLPNERVVDIAAGLQHCLLVTELGNVFSWGKNSSGEVDSSGDSVVVPTLVATASGNGGFSVACGAFEVCFLLIIFVTCYKLNFLRVLYAAVRRPNLWISSYPLCWTCALRPLSCWMSY